MMNKLIGSLEGNVLAQSPSYNKDFVFFRDLDLSIFSIGFLSYILLINMILCHLF